MGVQLVKKDWIKRHKLKKRCECLGVEIIKVSCLIRLGLKATLKGISTQY